MYEGCGGKSWCSRGKGISEEVGGRGSICEVKCLIRCGGQWVRGLLWLRGWSKLSKGGEVTVDWDHRWVGSHCSTHVSLVVNRYENHGKLHLRISVKTDIQIHL